MGVHGLWKLLEPVGKVVPLEGMAGKVLAVDISIWLHQAMKGMHDSHGAPIAVAHLLILFHRLCKLLFYKIKPVFVFDGGVPALKRQTMTVRRKVRKTAKNEAAKVRGKLLKNLLKHEAVRQMLSHAESSEFLGLTSLALPGSSAEEELFRLPPPMEDDKSEEISSEEEGDVKFAEDIHTIDVTSSDFKSLPPEVRHEILIELIETRKQSSWKHFDKMPKELGNFSDFQMNRLLKRRAVQSSLDEASKEMGGHTMSMKDLEGLLLNQPDPLMNDEYLPSKRIAQNEETRYVLIQKSDNVKERSEEQSEKEVFDFKEEYERSPNSSPSNCKNAGMLEKTKEEELSQDEIYDLIKKENEISCPKTTKLSKDRKMKLTADVIEVLPLLGSNMDNLKNCDNLLIKDNVIFKEIEVDHEEREENAGFKNTSTENVNVGTPGLSEICDDTSKESNELVSVSGSSASTKVGLLANKNCELNSFPITETKLQPKREVISSDDKPEDEPKKDQLEFPIGLSDESDDDFVTVCTKNENFLGNIHSFNSGNCENKSDRSIEVIINAEKQSTEADDIFADIFTKEGAKEIEQEFNEADSAFMERTGRDPVIPERMTTEDLKELQKSAAEEYSELMLEQGKQERFAQNISEQMNLDAQELLRLFGVPYVVAPMEAEAQCAILDIIGLTDGTITDDSDIWLFGGKVVYKNFFNQKKHVLQYRSEDIHKYFKLSREDMIKIALLVGSDYTSGLEGVGPVTALEILGQFPSVDGELLSGLKCFHKWFTKGEDINRSKGSLRRKIRNIKIVSGFPSEAVAEAYLHPQVDDSREPFSWAKPNIVLLQKYTQLKFGWTQEKCKELLTPVIERMMNKKNDTTLDKYFLPVTKDSLPEKVLSKRVENALKNMRNQDLCAQTADTNPKTETKSASTSKTRESKLSNTEIIPQKRAMERILEDRKRSAISIYKKSKKKCARQRPKIIVKEVNLSDSSSSSN